MITATAPPRIAGASALPRAVSVLEPAGHHVMPLPQTMGRLVAHAYTTAEPG
jgi:hypothetical protein